jgi:hypothetical protein
MILDKKVKIRINSNNYKYLNNIGYDNLVINDYIEIDVHELSAGSGHKILVKCDVCDNVKYLSYRRYMLSFNNGNYYACSNKCNIEKRKHIMTDETKEKLKKTCLERYGETNPFNVEEFKEKGKQTCIKKYGVDNIMKLPEMIISRRKSCMEEYGVDNISKLETIKEKKRQTCFKNHGVYYPTQNKKIFNKGRKTGAKIKLYEDTDIYYQGSYEKDFIEKYKHLTLKMVYLLIIS